MDCARRWRRGPRRLPAAWAGRSQAGPAVVPVRVRVFHRTGGRQPCLGHGAPAHRRRLGLFHPAPGPCRRPHAAADGPAGRTHPAGHAHALSVGKCRSAGARRLAAPAGLVLESRFFRIPKYCVFRAVARVPGVVRAGDPRQPAPAAHRRARLDRVRLDHPAGRHRLDRRAAAALAVLAALGAESAGNPEAPRLLQDLGNLLLMFVLGWSYLAFMQYLTIWIADLPAENVWYIPRTLTSWRWLAWFLIAFHFLVPFVTLLFLRAKRSRAWLGAIAGMLLAANLADAWWLVAPNFHPAGVAVHWTDLCAPVGIGGLWLCVYLGQLRAERRATDTGLRPAEAYHG